MHGLVFGLLSATSFAEIGVASADFSIHYNQTHIGYRHKTINDRALLPERPTVKWLRASSLMRYQYL
jgi:hypothetical protein